MKPEDYLPQETFSDRARTYHAEVMQRGAGIQGEDHRYGFDPYQSLAVYRAAKPSGAVLMFVHGGGWTNGYKEWMAFMAPALTAAGVTFVSAGYRLAPRFTFPTGFDDCAAALAWIYRHIDQYGGDPTRLFVGGHSAGGHYTSLLAVRRDWQARHDLPPSVIRGCLPISGVFRFGEGSGMTIRPSFLGAEHNDQPASPIAHISATPAPFFIAYGEHDFSHLIAQALAMAQALRAAGGEAVCSELKGCDHFTASYISGDAEGPWLKQAVGWMGNR